jgi:hypothetical protein
VKHFESLEMFATIDYLQKQKLFTKVQGFKLNAFINTIKFREYSKG